MLEQIPTYISFTFTLTTLATLLLVTWAIRASTDEKTRKIALPFVVLSLIWLLIQGLISKQNIYNTDTEALPPKIVALGILPMILVLILLFATRRGRHFIDSLPLKNMVLIHVVRIPVEIVLFWLCLEQTIPELMTFEGRNFDIIAGISAPVIAYFGFVKKQLTRNIVLTWNLICLGLLINIVLNALLSAPSPLQLFAFEQPNIAILNYPFSWLPTFVVPLVLFSHLVSIRQLMRQAK